MTATESDFEQRVRRDLAELGGLPASDGRELRPARRRRPAVTVSIALLAVLALVAGSFAIARAAKHRRTTVAATPRVHTILEQPATATALTSIAAHPLSQVCREWRGLPGGVDCIDLQARFVWEPGARQGPYTFGGIEVVGTPDLKIANAAAANQGYPVFESLVIRGHRARLFGTAQSLSLVWQERPDLQVFMGVSAGPVARPKPNALRAAIVAFAASMRPVVVDPAASQYVLRSGNTELDDAQPHDIRTEGWELTWRPRDRRLCMTVWNQNDCFAGVAPGALTVSAKGLSIIDGCPEPWVGTQGIAFGIVPEPTRLVVIHGQTQSGAGFGLASTDVVTPPGEPGLRVFAVALDHPKSAGVSAETAAGRTIARAQLPPFNFTCTR